MLFGHVVEVSEKVAMGKERHKTKADIWLNLDAAGLFHYSSFGYWLASFGNDDAVTYKIDYVTDDPEAVFGGSFRGKKNKQKKKMPANIKCLADVHF